VRVSKKRRRTKQRGSTARAYDWFPRSGLVHQYKAFVMAAAEAYRKRNPTIPWHDIISEAVRLAVRCEESFDKSRGLDFSTPLRHWLKGLNRLHEDRDKHAYVELETDEERALREAEEAGEPLELPPLDESKSNVAGGRIRLDKQWHGPGWEQRYRVQYRVKLRDASADFVEDVGRRISEELPTHLRGKPTAYMATVLRAAIAHHERRAREAQAEAENRRLGFGFAPVRFETVDLATDVVFGKGRSPPKFRPTRERVLSLDSDRVEGEGGKSRGLHEVVAAEAPDYMEAEARAARVNAEVAAMRATLDPISVDVLNYVARGEGTLEAIGEKHGKHHTTIMRRADRIRGQLATRLGDLWVPE
jgi:hypothetical protein